MSCGVCESHETPCKPRGQSQQSRSRYTSDTDESNYDDSAYTSDVPSGDECACNNDNAGDCCTKEENVCNNNGKSNQRSCSQSWQNQQRSQQYRTPSDSRSRQGRMSGSQPKKGCSCGSSSMTRDRPMSGSRTYEHPTSSQSTRQSSQQQTQVNQSQGRGPCSLQMTSSKTQSFSSSQRVASGSMGRGKLAQQSNDQYVPPQGEDSQLYYQQPELGMSNDMQPQQQPVPCGGMACNQYGSQALVNQQPPSNGQRGMMTNELQQQESQRFSNQGPGNGMRGSTSRYQPPPTNGKLSSTAGNGMMSTSFGPTSPSTIEEGQGQKQVIADCCLPNKSLLSLSDKTSQRTVMQNNSRMMSQDCGMKQEPTCGCSSKVNITNNVDVIDAFVCPSCAEFDNVAEINCCDEAEPEPEPEDEPSCEPEAVPLSEPEQIDDKQKKKSGGHGFWQQMQFQIFQQQDGDDDYNNSNVENNGTEQCICDNTQDGQPTEKVKKSGNKIWQKLTLDLFQSKDDDESGSENDPSPRQGWQQQFKLQLFQEKCQGDEEDQADLESPAPENGLQDQCQC